MPVVDDFEDGDLSGWNGDTGQYSVSSTYAEGSYSAGHSHDGNHKMMYRSFSPDGTPQTYRATIWTGTHNNETNWVDSANGVVFGIYHRYNNDVGIEGLWFSDRGERRNGTKIINASAEGDKFVVEITNIDWSAETCDVVVNGTTKLSGVAFINAGEPDRIQLHSNASTSSTDVSGWTDQIEYVEPEPAAPDNATATVDADDQVLFDWDADTSGGAIGHYEVEINRDGTGYVLPSGGPSTTTNTSETYTPSSDSAYDSQVGIDSSFRLRVRAVNTSESSGWSYSSTVYTTPIPPHSPSTSRPDGTAINIDWTNQSSIENGVEIQYREDSGTGWGSWTTATTTASGAPSYTNSSLPSDVRRQYRLRTVAPDGGTSAWVYAEYGNAGNVFFSDGFESGDFSGWGTASVANSSVTGSPAGDTGASGPDEGAYCAQLTTTDYIQEGLGDLSGETGVVVKAAVGAGSMDGGGEAGLVKWYDGSAWQTLDSLSWEYNKQGWRELTALVPDSYLSSDNRVRFECGGSGGGDFFIVDRVVVVDVLDEYTTPAAVSGLALDTSTEDEIGATWSTNATFATEIAADIKRSSSTAWETDAVLAPESTSHPYSGLDDGERYDIRPATRVAQYRRGSLSTRFTAGTTTAATTILPAPTDGMVDSVDGDQATLSWTNNHDYGNVRVEVKETNVSTWTDDSGELSLSTEQYTTSHLLDGETYDWRVVAYTDHTQTEDV